MEPTPSEASGAPLASSDSARDPLSPLRLGIVGCLSARARFGPALEELPAFQIAAIADPDLREARAWARKLPGRPSVHESLDAMLRAVENLDAVLVASPWQERSGHIQTAARARKAILCDAPFAATLEETDALNQYAAQSGALLLPALSRRFDAHCRQAAERIAAEGVKQARCDWTFSAYGSGIAETSRLNERSWRVLLPHMACQTADLCRWWLGDVKTVSADIESPQGRPEALANIIVTHERGQSVHQLARVRSTLSEERYRLSGERGALELLFGAGAAGETTASLTWNYPGQRPALLSAPEKPIRDAAAARNRNLLAHFADCLRAGRAPDVTGADARAALEIVFAAYLSAQEHTKVSLPLPRSGEALSLGPLPEPDRRALPPPDI